MELKTKCPAAARLRLLHRHRARDRTLHVESLIMKLTIIGTGYVGLVTGTCFAEVGHQVICVDNDAAKVKMLQAGGIPIYEPGLEELVKKNVAAGRLTFTNSTAEGVQNSDVIFIAVPTPPQPDGSVDLSLHRTRRARHRRRHDELQNRRGQKHRARQDRREGHRNHQALLPGQSGI